MIKIKQKEYKLTAPRSCTLYIANLLKTRKQCGDVELGLVDVLAQVRTLIQIQMQKVQTTKSTNGVSALVHEKMSPPAQVAEDQDYQMQYVQGYTLYALVHSKPHA